MRNLLMGLREGERPRVLVTTTPRAVALLRRLVDEPGVVLRGGKTEDNANLPADFVATMQALYGGTRLGRQEIDGELIADVEEALWTRDLIERCRVLRQARAAEARPRVRRGPGRGGAAGCRCCAHERGGAALAA